jgi:hypothetical protein
MILLAGAILGALIVVSRAACSRETVPPQPTSVLAPTERASPEPTAADLRETPTVPARESLAPSPHSTPAPLAAEPPETRASGADRGSGTRLSVRVIDQHGREIPGIALWLTRRLETSFEGRVACYFQAGDERTAFARQLTDAGGRATFEDVPPGDWWIGPEKVETEGQDEQAPAAGARAEAIAPVATFLELLEPEREHALVLEVERGLYLRGGSSTPVAREWARPSSAASTRRSAVS